MKVTKFALKVDFKPCLSVYTRMDSIGTALLHEFPDWNRTALSLELRNYNNRRLFRMAHNHCFFERDNPDDLSSELEFAGKVMDSALRKFEVNKISKAGVLHLFAAAQELSFEDVVVRFDNKFHASFSSLSPFDDSTLVDTAYVVNVRDRDDKTWTRNIQSGPMSRHEYFDRYPATVKLNLQSSSDLEALHSTIPEVFLFTLIDATCEDIERSRLIRNLSDVATASNQMAGRLNSFFLE